MRTNPFHEIYLAEHLPESEFVELFSEVLVPHVQLMFQPGNVVVSGMTGSGKSMLLKLLKLETRLIYISAKEYPVPKIFRKFLSCGLNLSHSSAIDFGYRSYEGMTASEVEGLFGDYVNSYLVLDLFANLQRLAELNHEEIHREIGFSGAIEGFRRLAEGLLAKQFGHGWFNGATDLSSLISRLSERIRSYRGFFAGRIDKLPDDLLATRSLIGEQFGELVDVLRECEIIAHDTHVFVDIDQYEELEKIASSAVCERRVDYRSVVHRALARRDPRVSFRIGARKHSWAGHLKIMGSNGKLEENRDYKLINLDEIFRREENSSTSIFPTFAEDIFKRRLKVAGFRFKDGIAPMEQVYGKSLKPMEKAKEYSGSASGDHIDAKTEVVSLEPGWSEVTKHRLLQLAKTEPLSARLGEAWIRQKGENFNLDVKNSKLPWETATYWKKERVEVGQMQIAARLRQRPFYSGKQEILELSGMNILTFISLNQFIWDEFLRFEANRKVLTVEPIKDSFVPVPTIERNVQQVGILRASQNWYSNLPSESGESSQRVKFLEAFARHLRQKLMSDKQMSYPGASGFSLKIEELDRVPAMRNLLNELVDYGNLIDVPHTTRESNRARRTKWYLNPVLCPHLGLPYKHIKEPLYVSIKEVVEIASKAQVNLSAFGPFATETPDPQQLLI